MLHADADFSIAVKSPVEAYDVGRVTLVQHLQLPNDLVPDGWFDFQVDQLENRKQVLFLFSCHTELEHKDINHVLVRTHARTLDTIHVMILRKNVRIYGPMCWLVIQTFQPIWIDACKKQCLSDIPKKTAVFHSVFMKVVPLLSPLLTFLAIIRPEGLWETLKTTPPLPAPSSQIFSKSSSFSSPTFCFCVRKASRRLRCCSSNSSSSSFFCSASKFVLRQMMKTDV